MARCECVDLDELMRGLRALVSTHEAEDAADSGEEVDGSNFDCVGCEGCRRCRFCAACRDCEDCTYCEECVECVSCTHAQRSVDCSGSSHLRDCRGCEDSRYLALCVDCLSCTYCLGCVGLEGAEFYVLNEPVSRSQYFKLAKAVGAEMEVRAHLGWRPEVVGLEMATSETSPDADGEAEESQVLGDHTRIVEGSRRTSDDTSVERMDPPARLPHDETASARREASAPVARSSGWISAIVNADGVEDDESRAGSEEVPEVTHTRVMDEEDVGLPRDRGPLEGPMARPRSAGSRVRGQGLSLVDLDALDGPEGPEGFGGDDALAGIEPAAATLGTPKGEAAPEAAKERARDQDRFLGLDGGSDAGARGDMGRSTGRGTVLDEVRHGPSRGDQGEAPAREPDASTVDGARLNRGRLTRGRRPARPERPGLDRAGHSPTAGGDGDGDGDGDDPQPA